MSREYIDELGALLRKPDTKDAINFYSSSPFHCVFISTKQVNALLSSGNTILHVGLSDFPLIKDIYGKRVRLCSMVQPNGLPIADFITTNNPAGNSICSCLLEAIEPIEEVRGYFTFKCIVVDWNFDLISGAYVALTDYSLVHSLRKMYSHMVSEWTYEIPFIQVCRIQLIEAMKLRLKGESSEVISAAIRLFYRLSECVSLQEAEDWFKHVVILFNSKHVSSQFEASLQAERTCPDPVTPAVSPNKPENKETLSWEQCIDESPFIKHFDKIRIEQEKILECDESKPMNILYSPGVLKHFQYFIPIFPLWCRYLVPMGVPLINSPLERRFNYVITDVFSNQRDLRPAYVVQTLIEDNEKLIDASNLRVSSGEKDVCFMLPRSKARRSKRFGPRPQLVDKNSHQK